LPRYTPTIAAMTGVAGGVAAFKRRDIGY